MKWSIRSMCAVAALSASPLLNAAEPRTQDGDKTVVTVVLAPFDTMVPNIQHLARLGGGGMAAGTVKTALTQYTAGLDTSRPSGIFVELDDSGQPTPIAALPLKDLDEFFGQLQIFGEPEDLGDGLFSMNLGNSFYMKNAGEWLVVGQTEDAVLNFDVEGTSKLKDLVAKYDILVDVRPQNIPDGLVQFLMAQFDAGVEQSMANVDEEQAEAARANVENFKKQMQEGIDGTESLKIGLAVNKADYKTTLDVGTRFVPGTKFVDNLKKLKSSKSTLSGVPQDSSTLTFQSLQLIAPEDVDQMKSQIDATMAAALKQIDDPAGAAKADKFLKQISELVLETAKEGQLEIAGDMSTTKNLSISGAFTVSDGAKVEAIAAEAAKELASSNGKVTLKVNTGKIGKANLHKLTVPLPPDADDKAEKIFGSTVNVVLATTPKAVYFAAGKDADDAIKSLLERSAAKASAPAEALKGRFSLGQLLKFMKSIETNPGLDAAVDVASAGNDKISIDSKYGERDAVIRISIEDNVIKAISAAGQAARGGGGF